LGHAFAQRLGLAAGTGRLDNAAYNALGSAQIANDPETGDLVHVAGDWGDGYVRTTHGYATREGPWQQNWWSDTPNEDFADMFLGWTYNHFASDATNPVATAAGDARYQWMSTNMTEWIALARR
jgi:hypothetical protein